MATLASHEVANLIEKHTSQGKNFLSLAAANATESPGVAKDNYGNAIKEFITAYKCALLLNSDRNAESACAFNLGAAHVAGGDTRRGVDVLLTVLDKVNTAPLPQQNGNNEGFEDASTLVSLSSKGDVYFNLGIGYEKMSNIAEAIKCYEQALNEYSSNMNNQLCETHMRIANIRVQLKQFMQAQMNFSAASRIYASINDHANSVLAMVKQANAAVSDCNVSNDDCGRLLQTCCKDCEKIKSKEVQGKVLCEVGLLYSAIGNLHHALACFEACIKLSKHSTNQTRRAVSLQNAGVILNRLKMFEKASVHLRQAAMLHGKLGTRNAQGQCFCTLGFAYSQMQMMADSCEAYNHALQASLDCDDKEGIWQAHEGLGIVYYLQENLSKAEYHLKSALAAHAQSQRANVIVQERIVKNLMSILKQQAREDAIVYSRGTYRRQLTQSTMKSIEYNMDEKSQINRNSPRPKTSPASRERVLPKETTFITEEASLQPPSQNRRSKYAKHKRGRREYNDNDQPIVHIARGISNLTQTSLEGFKPKKLELESDSDDSSKNVWKRIQKFILSSSDSESEKEAIPTKNYHQRSVNEGMKEIAEETEKLVSSPIRKKKNSNKINHQTPSRMSYGTPRNKALIEMDEEESDDDEDLRNGFAENHDVPTTSKDVSTTPGTEDNLTTIYKEQMRTAERKRSLSSSSDLTSVTAKSDLEDTQEVTSKSIPLRPAPVAKLETETAETEPVYAQSLKKSLKFDNTQDPSLAKSTHMYESIKPRNETTTEIPPLYDDVTPDEKNNEEENTGVEIKPLSSMYNMPPEPTTAHVNGDTSHPNEATTVQNGSRQQNDPLPPVPKKRSSKNKPSKACIIM